MDASFEAITVWMPSSKASACGEIGGFMARALEVENCFFFCSSIRRGVVHGYLSDISTYQYRKCDQTTPEYINMKYEVGG